MKLYLGILLVIVRGIHKWRVPLIRITAHMNKFAPHKHEVWLKLQKSLSKKHKKTVHSNVSNMYSIWYDLSLSSAILSLLTHLQAHNKSDFKILKCNKLKFYSKVKDRGARGGGGMGKTRDSKNVSPHFLLDSLSQR